MRIYMLFGWQPWELHDLIGIYTSRELAEQKQATSGRQWAHYKIEEIQLIGDIEKPINDSRETLKTQANDLKQKDIRRVAEMLCRKYNDALPEEELAVVTRTDIANVVYQTIDEVFIYDAEFLVSSGWDMVRDRSKEWFSAQGADANE